jgi:crossover junction endodeoxyribonuclease RuvC
MKSAAASITILGVDPGTRRMGFGWIEFDAIYPDRLIARGCGVIEPNSNLSLERRLAAMMGELELIFAERHPAKLVLESVFLSKNVSSAFVLGESRGVVLAMAGKHESAVLHVATKTAKKSVTGRGDSTKGDVQMVLDRLLHLGGALLELPLDASDGLALAYHGWRISVMDSLRRENGASL